MATQATTTAGQSPTYKAAVVEFAVHMGTDEKSEQLNAKNHAEIIKSEDVKSAQIVVFPEAVLNHVSRPVEVPKVEEKIVPCTADKYSGVLRTISCAARDASKYVVAQVYMKRNCKEESANDTRPCTKDDINIYNTAVAFDKTGQVVAV